LNKNTKPTVTEITRKALLMFIVTCKSSKNATSLKSKLFQP